MVDVEAWVQIAVAYNGRKVTALINGHYFSVEFEAAVEVEEEGYKFGDKIYEFYDVAMTWDEANSECLANN